MITTFKIFSTEEPKIGKTFRFDHNRLLPDGSIMKADTTYEVVNFMKSGEVAWDITLEEKEQRSCP